MPASSATIIDFEDYRRRRTEARGVADAPSAPPATHAFVWYPLWMMFPLWSLSQPAPGERAHRAG